MTRNTPGSRPAAASITIMLIAAGLGLGRPALAADGQTPSPGLFDKDRVGVEFGLGLLTEAWNSNGSRESVADGTLGVWWAFASRATLVVEFHATRVFQESPRDAFVTGIAPVVRIKALDRGQWDMFAEFGIGGMWSDTAVPARGTRFNYLGIAGLGLSRALGEQTSLTTGVRWWHLSNNGLEGRDHNPDIQALGGYVALTIAF
jgi:hypothetical protein